MCTTVCVDGLGIHKADLDVVKDSRFVEVAQSRQVVLSNQDVWVPQEGEGLVLTPHRVRYRLGTTGGAVLLHTVKYLCYRP